MLRKRHRGAQISNPRPCGQAPDRKRPPRVVAPAVHLRGRAGSGSTAGGASRGSCGPRGANATAVCTQARQRQVSQPEVAPEQRCVLERTQGLRHRSVEDLPVWTRCVEFLAACDEHLSSTGLRAKSLCQWPSISRQPNPNRTGSAVADVITGAAPPRTRKVIAAPRCPGCRSAPCTLRLGIWPTSRYR